jgi:hypothetical protein
MVTGGEAKHREWRVVTDVVMRPDIEIDHVITAGAR